jgi:hypothetical protein
MTEWGIDTLFNPGKRHLDEEKRRLQSTREEVGDSSGGRRVDLDSGKVVISRKKPAASADESPADEANRDEANVDEASPDEASPDEASADEASDATEQNRPSELSESADGVESDPAAASAKARAADAGTTNESGELS